MLVQPEEYTPSGTVRKIRRIEQTFGYDGKRTVGWDILQSLRLPKNATRQKIVIKSLVTPTLRWLPGINVETEGFDEHFPEGPCFIAMNHSDSYNYLPLWDMLLKRGRYGTGWVKGKNYTTAGRLFFNVVGMIPIPPLNYTLQKLYEARYRRLCTPEKVRELKRAIKEETLEERCEIDVQFFKYHKDDIEWYHEQLMKQVGELTKEALNLGLFVLIFPEGTRSVKLGEGHTGIAQIALQTNVPIIPIGCSGGNNIYPPGSWPFAQGPQGRIPSWIPGIKKGRVTYRCGKPLTTQDALAPYKIDEAFETFSPESQQYKQQFEGATDIVMQTIHDLVDEQHKNYELYV